MEQVQCKVTMVTPVITEHELKQFLSEIERIAYEIAKEGDDHELSYLDVI